LCSRGVWRMPLSSRAIMALMIMARLGLDGVMY